MFLRQSTQVVVKIGPFLDATDGVTEETGLAAGGTEISKSPGAAFAAGPTLGTHDAEGWYPITLTTSHTDTVGRLVVKSHNSATHLPVWHEFYVLEEAIFDALVAASAAGFDSNQRVDVGSWLGTAVTTSATTSKPQVDVDSIDDDATAADNAELFFDNTGFTASNSTIGTCTTNTDMRGTDSAALASVVGALADAAAAGDPTSTDTLMAYAKQLINTLEGAAGIPTFPAESAPGNAVSLAEIIRAIHTDVTGLNGDAMRGTDSAFLAASAPSNFSSTVISASGVVDANAAELLGNAGAANVLSRWMRGGNTGTAQGGGASTITLASGDSAADNELRGHLIILVSGTGSGQDRFIVANDNGTKVATVDRAWTTNPDATTTYGYVPMPWLYALLDRVLSGNHDTADTAGGILQDLDTNVPEVLSLANINAEVDSAFTTQMADSVPSDGTIATREQALYMILQFLSERSVTSTTVTVNKVDGSTALMTFTLNDATSPTSITRAT